MSATDDSRRAEDNARDKAERFASFIREEAANESNEVDRDKERALFPLYLFLWILGTFLATGLIVLAPYGFFTLFNSQGTPQVILRSSAVEKAYRQKMQEGLKGTRKAKAARNPEGPQPAKVN
jgi:hypothetical protein